MGRLAFLVSLGVMIAGGCATGGGKADPTARRIDPERVLNQTWQWVATITPVEKIEVQDPERYTIRLTDDGKIQARFDCNRGGGTYEISPGRLSFGPLLSTRMACPPDSLDAPFMRDLQRVASFFIEGGDLYLELPFDSGTMRFQPAPPAAADPLEATYVVEGQPIQLRRGRAARPAAPGAATSIETRVYGHPEYGDLNGDGLDDALLFLQHDPGGSGTFYYVAVALYSGCGWQGTYAILLGDRIVPRGIEIRRGEIVVNYLGRLPEEALSAPATVARTMILTVEDHRIRTSHDREGGTE